MKTEFTDVSATQKTITIEIPVDVVDAEINRVARGYTKQARIPGFRPGKVPTTLVKRRFKEQILHDEEANAMVRRQYRDHWGTPKGV